MHICILPQNCMVYAYRSIFIPEANKRIGEYAWADGKGFGVRIGWRKYMYECTHFGYVNLWKGCYQNRLVRKSIIIIIIKTLILISYIFMWIMYDDFCCHLCKPQKEVHDINWPRSEGDNVLGSVRPSVGHHSHGWTIWPMTLIFSM